MILIGTLDTVKPHRAFIYNLSLQASVPAQSLPEGAVGSLGHSSQM